MTAASLTGTITERIRPRTHPELTTAQARKHKMREAFMLALLAVTVFIAAGYTHNFIPSESMEPNLRPGDHIVTMREWLAYPFGAMPSRGDIIVFRLPQSPLSDSPALSSSDRVSAATLRSTVPTSNENDDTDNQDASNDSNSGKSDILIKRVVGLPGDVIQLKENTLYVNGKPVPESYHLIPVDNRVGYDFPYAVYEPLRVPSGHLFVLGDNRNNSDDGRFWGTLPRQNVLGRFLRIMYHESKYDLSETALPNPRE